MIYLKNNDLYSNDLSFNNDSYSNFTSINQDDDTYYKRKS